MMVTRLTIPADELPISSSLANMPNEVNQIRTESLTGDLPAKVGTEKAA